MTFNRDDNLINNVRDFKSKILPLKKLRINIIAAAQFYKISRFIETHGSDASWMEKSSLYRSSKKEDLESAEQATRNSPRERRV